MKIRWSLLLCVLCFATTGMAQEFSQTANGMKGVFNGTDIEICFYSPTTVRIVKAPTNRAYTKESYSVIAQPKKVKVSTTQKGANVIVKSNKLQVILNKADGSLSFSDAKGNNLLKEKGATVFTPFDDAGNQTFNVKQAFTLDKDETIYGLGNLEKGKLSQRNMRHNLTPGNVEDGMSLFQSIKGYGVFWDNYSPTLYVDNEEETSFTSEVGDCADYYFMYGGSADGVVAEIRALTGEVPMFPLWTYGFWQSKERYKTQDETMGVLRTYREQQIPIDGIIQDWQYWGNNYLWNAMEFMSPDFPNPQQMIDYVHSQNAHIIPSIWSSFGPETKPYAELDAKGMLFNFSTWPQSGISHIWPPRRDYPSGVRVYDAYNPEARDIYWKHLTRLHNMDMDGWWMDSTEPDHLDFKPEDMDTPTHLGSFRKVRSAYPLLTVGGVYDNQRKVSSDKRVFILTRSAFIGQQRYGSNVWTGDVNSTWEMLRNQIPALLNFSLTGQPNCNSDIGGFFANAYNGRVSAVYNPAYRELYVRWMQFGAFTPMMRSHGADVPREVYLYGKSGEPIYDALVSAIKLRYNLLPYIYSTSWQVTKNQYTPMRALMMDFAADKQTWNIDNEYMYGPAILVAPIVKAQYTPEVIRRSRTDEDGWNREAGDPRVTALQAVDFTKKHETSIYLPAGATWYDFWNGTKHKGGETITRETTIDLIPLYIKAGSILPIGPEVQYAEEKAWDNLELRVYPGANGSFTLYEDEFDNYNYEKGAYTEIPMTWNDKARKLTIGKRIGSYEGMLKERTFTVVTPDGKKKSVKYNGKSVSVSF
ncbi:MAG: glycoside hydrolase family 31 protein [Bacteroides sp.]|nr:glycoside hydrolase family 31 protein [Bacteroides sp.]